MGILVSSFPMQFLIIDHKLTEHWGLGGMIVRRFCSDLDWLKGVTIPSSVLMEAWNIHLQVKGTMFNLSRLFLELRALDSKLQTTEKSLFNRTVRKARRSFSLPGRSEKGKESARLLLSSDSRFTKYGQLDKN